MKSIASFVVKISSLMGVSKGIALAELLGADFSKEYDTLLSAIEGDHPNVVQHLIDAGVCIKQNNNFAVGWAAACGKTEITRLLVIEGADFRASDQWALRQAAGNGHLETVDYLLFMGADPTANGYYAILIAIEKGYTRIVKLFLERGYKVPNIQYYITRCGEKGYLELMKALVIYSNTKVLKGG